ncbi:hypothetical protein [Streptomyces sp. MNU76]|uniref:hypothetical protein n=1 Tax=Streptomyces sp. MNU76 TaxID=2560026 RepID=UPI0035A87282
MHAYASALLDAGENIKALSEYLGHSDPGFTLRTYTHLLPSSDTHTRKAIDDAFTEEAEQGGHISALARANVPWPPEGASRHTMRVEPLKLHPMPKKPQVRATPGNKADAPPHATDG